MRRAYSLVLALLVILLGAAPVLGQTVSGDVISAGIGGTRTGGAGLYRRGSWVPVRVRLESRSAAAQEVVLAVEQKDLDGDTVTCVSPKFTLVAGPDPVTKWVYYWPKPNERVGDDDYGLRHVQVLDASSRRLITTLKGVPAPVGYEPVRTRSEDARGEKWTVLVGESTLGMEHFVGSKGGNEAVRFSSVPNAPDLPDRSMGLDGVDVVILQGENAKVGMMNPEFELAALLEWVRAGGHLIVTVGSRWPELAAMPKLSEALPLELPREGKPVRELAGPAASELLTDYVRAGVVKVEGNVFQAVGKAKNGARVLGGPGEAPLVVTGMYGNGTVTLVTVDMASPTVAKALGSRQWMQFWQRAALWKGWMLTAADYKDREKGGVTFPNSGEATLDTQLAKSIDFTGQAAVGMLLAVLFLGGYWAIAGPGGHAALKYYGRTHWSWWIFGATVVVASLAAVGVATLFRLERYDLRHNTYVMGTVGTPEASVLGFYGVYAPVDGSVKVELPEAMGMAYLVPFNEPTDNEIRSYPDPQGYQLENAKAAVANVPFRNTLKSMQARWVGAWGGMVQGDGLTIRNLSRPGGGWDLGLEGTLANRTGYDLRDVRIAAVSSRLENGQFFEVKVDAWKDGDTVDIKKLVSLRREFTTVVTETGEREQRRVSDDSLEAYLVAMGRKLQRHIVPTGGYMVPTGEKEGEDKPLSTDEREAMQVLDVLLDWRQQEPLSSNDRVEVSRRLTRMADRSVALRASRLVIVARAGDKEEPVKSPLSLKVNGRELRGQGTVLFSWVAQPQEINGR